LSRKLSKQHKAEKERPFQRTDISFTEFEEKTEQPNNEYTPERIAELKQKTLTVDKTMTAKLKSDSLAEFTESEIPLIPHSNADSLPSSGRVSTSLRNKEEDVVVVLRNTRPSSLSSGSKGPFLFSFFIFYTSIINITHYSLLITHSLI
jgi:hypothetical protein